MINLPFQVISRPQTPVDSTPVKTNNDRRPSASSRTPSRSSSINDLRASSRSSSINDLRSDIESDAETPRKVDQLGKQELREKYLKQEQTLKRFRQKFSEVGFYKFTL